MKASIVSDNLIEEYPGIQRKSALLNVKIPETYTYYSHLMIPEGVAEASQIFLRDAKETLVKRVPK
jgi:hypothetical protein